jgi:hypothetical protein
MAKQTFTTGQVLTAAQMTSLHQTAMLGGAASAKTASYTLVAADAGTAISMSNASATTITVNTALFAAGDTVQITNLGVGVCTITAGTATVNTSASLALAQYESGTLDFTSTSAAIFIKGAGAAPTSSSGLTKITSGTFSNVASVTVDDVFSATYLNYMMILNISAATRTDKLHMQLRYGSNTQTTSYYSAGFYYNSGNTITQYGESATAQLVLGGRTGTASESTSLTIYFSKVGNTSENPSVWANGNIDGTNVGSFAGWDEVARTYTGFLLKSASSNITGKYQIYGLEN